MSRERIDLRLHFRSQCRSMDRGGTTHHVPHHIAASTEARQLDGINPPNDVTQTLLQDAVQLQTLPVGDAERPVSQLIAELQLGEELPGGEFASREPRPHEKAVLAFAISAQIAIV